MPQASCSAATIKGVFVSEENKRWRRGNERGTFSVPANYVVHRYLDDVVAVPCPCSTLLLTLDCGWNISLGAGVSREDRAGWCCGLLWLHLVAV